MSISNVGANVYLEILRNVLPKGYCFAFAYGSGVFKQVGNFSVKSNMMDFIIAVDKPIDWHRKNIAMNPNHYSFLKHGGPENIANLQDNFGAKTYFNTLIPTYAGMIKYGVISKENLITDLLDWETLYVAGRLHKPVSILHLENDESLKSSLKINLFSSIHTALLLLPECFSEHQLYFTIANISYSGDFRMQVGEDRNKVQNIVLAQMEEFRRLYSPILQELRDHVVLDYSRGTGQQDVSYISKFYHLSMLPKMLQKEVVQEWNRDKRIRDLEDVLRAAAVDPDSTDVVYKGISSIVQHSSLSQSVKGILTAGIRKSFRYSMTKMKKMLRSLQR